MKKRSLTRVLNNATAYLGALLVPTVFLVCCVNYTTRVDFSLSTWAGRTRLNVYVMKPGFMFNPHASHSDRYEFVFPSGEAHIPAARISEYFVHNQKQPPAFAETGGIELKIDDTGCEIRVNLAGADGRALPVNGTHGVRYCGLDKI